MVPSHEAFFLHTHIKGVMKLVKSGRAFLSLRPLSSTLGFVGFVFAIFAFKAGMVGVPLSSFGNGISTLFFASSLDEQATSPQQELKALEPASSTHSDSQYNPCVPDNHSKQSAPLSTYSHNMSSSSSLSSTADRHDRNHAPQQDLFPFIPNVRKLAKCNLFTTRGKWIKDDRYPLYKPDTCPFVTNRFNCQQNGRPDTNYTRWRWAPRGCKLPRFSGKYMLEILRGKSLVFVGDSLNHNQWQSMLCMLRESLADRSRVVKQPRSNFAWKFLDYNCTVEFQPSLYLADLNNTHNIIRLDTIDKLETKWRKADVLVFNTGHWWGPGKIGNGENCFQEGDKVYDRFDVKVAYKKALSTWGQWVDTHVDPQRTRVFFRTLSPQHFRGGKWNLGGHCEDETEPLHKASHVPMDRNEMRALEEVIGAMKVQVIVLNVTNLSAYRTDAHPSVYWHPLNRTLQQQDCGHWCLPGLPDTWNELFYFSLIKNLPISP